MQLLPWLGSRRADTVESQGCLQPLGGLGSPHMMEVDSVEVSSAGNSLPRWHLGKQLMGEVLDNDDLQILRTGGDMG